MNKDYEQLYYDALYEIKQLKAKIKSLEEEKEVALIFASDKDKSLKKILSKEIATYLSNKRRNNDKKV